MKQNNICNSHKLLHLTFPCTCKCISNFIEKCLKKQNLFMFEICTNWKRSELKTIQMSFNVPAQSFHNSLETHVFSLINGCFCPLFWPVMKTKNHWSIRHLKRSNAETQMKSHIHWREKKVVGCVFTLSLSLSSPSLYWLLITGWRDQRRWVPVRRGVCIKRVGQGAAQGGTAVQEKDRVCERKSGAEKRERMI